METMDKNNSESRHNVESPKGNDLHDNLIIRGFQRGFLCVAILGLVLFVFSFLDLRILSLMFPILNILVTLATFTAFGAVFYYMNKQRKGHQAPTDIRFKILTFFFICASLWLFAVLSSTIQDYKTRREIRAILSHMSIADVKITIDGVEINQKVLLFEAIKNIRLDTDRVAAIYERPCVLSCSTESLTLTIGRDRNRPDLFWVYYPKYKFSRNNVIGAFNTDIAEMKQFDAKSRLYP